MGIITKIFGDPNEKTLKTISPIIEKINSLEANFQVLSDSELKAMTEKFRKRLAGTAEEDEKEALEDILPEVFAAVREASRRVLGQRHYDAQLIGGVVLHRGQIAEMKTGEGKTLVATLPLYLNALPGRGVHLVTVNDYLSRVGAGWMAPVYHLLGMTTGVIIHDAAFIYDPEYTDETQYDKRLQHYRKIERKDAYNCDILYGTNNEFGFDYLRDNMVPSPDRMVQRGLYYAIVDEIDSILIDEARTPLIISAPAEESTDKYYQFAQLVKRLEENKDYNVDEKMRAATLTEEGIAKMEKLLNVENIYTAGGIREVHHIEQALKAHALFKRDRDYVVKDGEVVIVDEFTGRLMYGRRYSEGLHQAIEAREGVKVQRESETLATITFQNFFRMYKKLAGMTGTAMTEAEEFYKIYNLETVAIPTNKPMIRKDLNDLIYRTEDGKFKAVIEDIGKRHTAGQPLLIGTISIEKNELLAAMMERAGLHPEMLNAKNHEKEARIIAEAGKMGAITLATNMAGRGVDIMLGGVEPPFGRQQTTVGQYDEEDSKSGVINSEQIQNTNDKNSKYEMGRGDHLSLLGRDDEHGNDQRSGKDDYRTYLRDNLIESDEHKKWREEHDKIVALGGLHVIGTERHEARRIDNQLRGRAGRQGDSGSSQFYVSTEDDLMRIFGGDRMKSLMTTLRVPDDMPIENKLISKSIESAQVKVEGNNFDIRKHLVEYDDVINKHREAIYRRRRQILGMAEGARQPDSKTTGQQDDKQSSFAKDSEGEPTSAISDVILTTPEQERNPDENKAALVSSSAALNGNNNLSSIILDMVENEIEQVVSFHTDAERMADWNLNEILQVTSTIFPVDEEAKKELANCTTEGDKLDKAKTRTQIIECLVGLSKKFYDKMKRRAIAAGVKWTELEKAVLIRSIDMLWIEHLEAMSSVRQGIGLRGYGQRDPLIEYKKEAYSLFNELNNLIQKEVVYSIYKIGEMYQAAAVNIAGPSLADRAREFTAPAKEMNRGEPAFANLKSRNARAGKIVDSAQVKAKDAFGRKIGRNDPCPCGSGKKYKRCHGS